MRWPEFGYGIAPAMDARPVHGSPACCRGAGARDERHWPKFLIWGTRGRRLAVGRTAGCTR